VGHAPIIVLFLVDILVCNGALIKINKAKKLFLLKKGWPVKRKRCEKVVKLFFYLYKCAFDDFEQIYSIVYFPKKECDGLTASPTAY